MVCAKVNGEPVYEIHRPIAAHQELVVYYLAERPEELLFVHMRSTLYRRTMDSILEGKFQINGDIIIIIIHGIDTHINIYLMKYNLVFFCYAVLCCAWP